MKPKNFPGRKNDRRKAALSRMRPPVGTQSHAAIALHPYTILSSRIMPDEMARAIRTKKDRTSRAKVRA